uniref:Uncharacterized protein n=1 Tax=Ciona intestinalis TaxID=7719 RepID=H2XUA3_CIOIN
MFMLFKCRYKIRHVAKLIVQEAAKGQGPSRQTTKAKRRAGPYFKKSRRQQGQGPSHPPQPPNQISNKQLKKRIRNVNYKLSKLSINHREYGPT